MWLSSISDAILTNMSTDVFAKSANAIAYISPILQAGFGLYIVLIALTYYNRGMDESIVDLTKRCMGWMIVIAFATNAGLYLKLANMLYELPEEMSSALVSSKYSASALDAAYDEFIDKAAGIFDSVKEMDMTDIAGKLAVTMSTSVMVVVGTIFFVIILAFYLVAKLSLAMVILVGPLFIGALLFPATRQWGMNWIGQVLNYAITISFYVLLTAIQTQYFESTILRSLNDLPMTISMASLFPVLCLFVLATIIFVIVAWSVPSIASSLTGGASIGGFAQFANTIRQTVRLGAMGKGMLGSRAGGSIGKAK